jgi:hypothetical protein
MPDAGYSGTPLRKKLGISDEARVGFAAEGHGGTLPPRCDVLVFFVTRRAELEVRLADLLARMDPAGSLWISWPKRSSRLSTDLTDNVLRDVILPTGWVDNKVAAIDEAWSAVRFVLRKHLRPA